MVLTPTIALRRRLRVLGAVREGTPVAGQRGVPAARLHCISMCAPRTPAGIPARCLSWETVWLGEVAGLRRYLRYLRLGPRPDQSPRT